MGLSFPGKAYQVRINEGGLDGYDTDSGRRWI